MNILVISPIKPFDQNSGDSIRILQFIRHLSKNNTISLIYLNAQKNSQKFIRNSYEKDMYCIKTWEIYHNENKYLTLLKWLFDSRIYREVKFYNNKFNEIINDEVYSNKYDVIFINFIDTVQHLKYKHDFCKPLVVLDQHNYDKIWFQSFVNTKLVAKKIFGKINLIRLSKVQKIRYRNIDLSFSVSEEEKKYTKNDITSKTIVEIAPNGVDLDYFKTKNENKKNNEIIFCGSMDVIMNQDAVLNFCKNIFPKIMKQTPTAKFNVVGKNPPLLIKRLDDGKNIHVTGTVDDVRPYYEKSKVAVAPFRMGGGTKLKILEAMAMKVPIVSSKIGCHGIEAENDKHIFIARNDNEFAKMVTSCIKNCSNDIIDNANQLVCEKYSWANIVHDAEMRIHEVRNDKFRILIDRKTKQKNY